MPSHNKGKKKHIDLSCLSQTPPAVQAMLKLGVPPGMYLTTLDEDFARLETGACEVVYSGLNNSEIVLGRDRNASLASGKGGKGGTGCGSIDLVAGRLSSVKNHCEKLTGPNFASDAARVYITQRGHIDNYYALPDGRCGSTDNASAVGIKADHTRIIGRETVRIYAGKGLFDGQGADGELNSNGGKIGVQGVIELVSGNGELQKAVLGDNLAQALKQIFKLIAQAFSAIHMVNLVNQKVFSVLAGHSHQGTGVGAIVTFPDPMLAFKTYQAFAKANIGAYDNTMSIFNAAMEQMNYTGVGEPDLATLPGYKDILSTKIFLT